MLLVQVLQYVDADTLTGLVPRLVDLIKGNVGIGAKGSTAHLVTTLTHQCPLDLQVCRVCHTVIISLACGVPRYSPENFSPDFVKVTNT